MKMSYYILYHIVLPAEGWFKTAWNVYLSTSACLWRHSELDGVPLSSCFWPRADVWGLRGQSPLWSLHNSQSSSLFAISAIISVTENKALSEEEEEAMALGASLCGGHGLQLYHRSDRPVLCTDSAWTSLYCGSRTVVGLTAGLPITLHSPPPSRVTWVRVSTADWYWTSRQF